MKLAVRLIVCALAALAALGAGGRASAQSSCPTLAFLAHDGVVYAELALPESVRIEPGAALGDGSLDRPVSEDGCKRERDEVTTVRAGEIDPRVAVMAEDRPDVLFVLGGRCSGYEGQARWDCLLRPLTFQGVLYTGVAYPSESGGRGTVGLGAPLGGGELGGAAAGVVRIEGVDPAVAVGVAGRPGEAFVAPGACPYERFAGEAALDDLSRCLRAPVWFVFDPLGAAAGAGVTATADRRLAAELEGAEVALVRLGIVADVVPRDRSAAVTVATIARDADGGVALALTVPDLEQGLYEAVVTCEPCAPAFGERTLFPAGSLLVFAADAGGGGSSSARLVAIAIGVVLFALIGVALVTWRRGWHRRGPGRPPAA